MSGSHLEDLADLSSNELDLQGNAVWPLQLNQLTFSRGSHFEAVSALETNQGGKIRKVEGATAHTKGWGHSYFCKETSENTTCHNIP